MKRSANFIPVSRGSNLKPLELPDCIYLTEHCRCGILQVNECIGYGCSFCQDSSTESESFSRWLSHMNTMSKEKQAKIAVAYYGGKMPWQIKDERDDNI